ncbi:MAG: TlyA family RNA methyltransferase [Acholeplasmataceae bacterium]
MRIDLYMVDKNLVQTRSQARDLIMRGLVFHQQKQVTKAGYEIDIDDEITVLEGITYVSRAGLKLEDALTHFKIDLKDCIILDVGASTGGFTDCALAHGAKHVYAYDVGLDQLDETLKNHPQVTSFEKTNILSITPPLVDVILIDVSFTSIKPILNHLKDHDGIILALIKPQFEAGKINMKQGVLKDKKIIEDILKNIITYCNQCGFYVEGIKKSDLKGKSGNQEYMFYLKKNTEKTNTIRRIGDFI